jgi:predicted metal-dependent TIM-barrel fold hydrolase
MQLIINVPDTLSQERLTQIIKEVEQRLINEAKLLVGFSKKQTASFVSDDDPWMNLNVDLPCFTEKRQYPNFVDFIRNSPLMNADVDFERDNSLCREVEL